VVLAQKTFDRTRQLAEHGNAPLARLDQATDSLHESQRALDQAKSAYEQAVNGYTREERQIAEANVGKATADIEAVKSIIDHMTVYAPVPISIGGRANAGRAKPGFLLSPPANGAGCCIMSRMLEPSTSAICTRCMHQ
jgi:HlyD family secretion protein